MSEFDAAADAEALRAAMKGWGTHEEGLNNIICARPRAHLQLVEEEYRKKFWRNLYRDVKRETSGDYEAVLLGLLMSAAEYRVQCIKDATRGIGTEEEVLIDTICCATHEELQKTHAAYDEHHWGSLTNHVKRDVSGQLQKVLSAVLEGERETGIKQDLIASDSKELFEAADGFGTDEAKLIEILTKRSHAHLMAVGDHYEKTHGAGSLERTIRRETKGSFENALLAVFEHPETYVAQRLHDSIRGPGTNEADLTRFILMPEAHQLAKIARKYQTMFNQDLATHVEADAGGHYGHALATRIKASLSWH